MVYICKLMSWQKRGHLLGNAPPLASAAAPSGEEWGLLRIRHRPFRVGMGGRRRRFFKRRLLCFCTAGGLVVSAQSDMGTGMT